MAKSRVTVQAKSNVAERIRIVYVVWLETRWPLMESVCRGTDRVRFDLSFVAAESRHAAARTAPRRARDPLDSRPLPAPLRPSARAMLALWRHCRGVRPDIILRIS